MVKQKKSNDESEVSIRLDNYDAIFSDFDIRPYSHRALSDDFLLEMKRAASERPHESIQLALYVPRHSRHPSKEAVIRGRLQSYFRHHYHQLTKTRQSILRRGWLMFAVGVVCMMSASFLLFSKPEGSYIMSLLVVFLEPAAWFLLWEGMNQIIFNAQNANPDVVFYRRMTHVNGRIHFRSYIEPR